MKKEQKTPRNFRQEATKPKSSKELMSSLTVCNYIHLKKTMQTEFGENDGV